MRILKSNGKFEILNQQVGVSPEIPSTPGEGSSYIHDQSIPQATWIINHGLGYFPNVTSVDSSGRRVFGDVQYANINSLAIHYSGGFAGKAYLS